MTIVSFSRRFIFIKTRKTAGTSMEVQLERLCGENDIVTSINPPNLSHRPRNHGSLFVNHMPATTIRALLPEAFAQCFKFCVERHPVEKCLSQFGLLKNSPDFAWRGNPRTWEAFLERGEFPNDVSKYCDGDGAVIVDKIYRYEQLDAAVRDISERLDAPFGPLDAREKSGFRTNVPSFEQVMNDSRQKALIMTAFADSLRITPYD